MIYNHLGIYRQRTSIYINKKTTKKIHIPSSNDTIRRTIQQLKTTNTFKYLGVTLAPDGNPHYQFQVILQSTKTGSIIIVYNPFTYNQAFLYLILYLLYHAYTVCLSTGRKYIFNVVWSVLCRAL